MPKTAVGLFKNPVLAQDVVREIKSLGFPRGEIRTLTEPTTFDVNGVMSFPRLDFEVDLKEELARIGATEQQAQVYLEGVRDGGALVFATGKDHDVEAAADVMNRNGAVEIEQGIGPEPYLPTPVAASKSAMRDTSVMTGRFRHSGGGASFFVW
jgi:hypothetical protein